MYTGIGGDPFNSTNFVDCVGTFLRDPETEGTCMFVYQCVCVCVCVRARTRMLLHTNFIMIPSYSYTVMDRSQQLHDHNIRILRNDTLGSGSYGVVCKAMLGQRLCAAKLLHLVFFQSNDPGIVTTRRRFEQECQFLNDMKHPHIVEYLGTSHDPDSGLQVLLMELMDESLTHFLERSQQPLAYHIEVDLCHGIAQALAYIHSKDIIHRDLSGNNVLLLAGRAKITDFGMSKLLDANRRMTPLTMCPGTLAYMPPEALREPPVYSKKMDCFSFGVLQIQIMTRQFPDPGPLRQVVEDSRSPTGIIEIPVLDSERRKSHIDLIDSTHTLLPTALSCLSYSEKDRPSAQDLCRQLAAFKGAPRYAQLQALQQELQTKDQQLQDSQRFAHTLQQELQTKDHQLQDSQQLTHTLQQELQTKDQQLQDSQRQIQQLTHQVEEKQHTIDDKETLLRELNQQGGAQPHKTITPPRLKHRATGNRQLQPMKQPGSLPRQTVMRQKSMRDMRWQKKSKAPKKMLRGSAAVDGNMAYFNGRDSAVHSYDLDTQEWHQLPDAPYIYFTLVVVHHILTLVGGQISGKVTDFLLSFKGERRGRKWLPILPAMPTKRCFTSAICIDHSLIVTGGSDGSNTVRLTTVEVLDTDTQQWSIASSLAHPFSEATISICGERLYMLGGLDQTGFPGTRSVLSCSIPELLQSCQPQPLAGKLRTAPANKSTIWRYVADAPHYWLSCATFCGQLVAVGGVETSTINVYNETTDSWKAMGHMPTARLRALVAILNGKMMVVGGVVGSIGGLVRMMVGGIFGGGWGSDVVEILC